MTKLLSFRSFSPWYSGRAAVVALVLVVALVSSVSVTFAQAATPMPVAAGSHQISSTATLPGAPVVSVTSIG